MAVVNVQDRALNLAIVKTIEATEDEIARYSLKADDLLLTEGGGPDKLGRGTLWQSELSECIHQNHVFCVRLTSNLVHPLFLLATVVNRIKSASAREANRALGRVGALWQRAFHDHALRSDEDVVAVAHYIVANPIRAGLARQAGQYPFWNAVVRCSRQPISWTWADVTQ